MALLPISDRSDAALVRDARDGQPEAFNALVRRWERKVYSYLVHLTGQPEDALDMCQEVFVSAYKHLGRLRDAEGFRPWLFQIAHNTACSEMRRLRGRQFDEALDVVNETNGGRTLSSSLPGNRTGLGRSELKLMVEKALAALSLEQREAVILKVYQGFKFTEIAEIQSCPLSTVKTRVYAGFEQLRKLLEA
ncbi:MAG TPA: sigma-70 family RNA polymerase sigma factor [Terriglobia bacterium]|nr:sigma-70 family RNA polymerase sigma factor [Terriglobia bacterium]